MKSRSLSLIGFCGLLVCASSASAGTVTGVTVSQRTIAAGATVTVKVAGTNPCGAAHIIYGDGDAITYAITGLPVEQTHVYQKVGNFTITARGMGNCDGEATTTLTVSAPPEPRPRASISAVEIAPTPARVQEPVAVVTRGTGTCSYEVQYGDGTAEQVNADLPEETHHTYANPGRYTVIVRPNAPCVGKFTEVLQVEDAGPGRTGGFRRRRSSAPPEPAQITQMVPSPSPGVTGEPIAISVQGRGNCAYDIYYGDGRAEEVSGELPRETPHVYSRAGRYAVVVKPQPPCTGKFTEVVQVSDPRPTGPRITRVTVVPTPAAVGQAVTINVEGSSACNFRIDYDDGNWDSRSMTLPATLRHVYSAPGSYTVTASPEDSRCTGSGRATFEVRR